MRAFDVNVRCRDCMLPLAFTFVGHGSPDDALGVVLVITVKQRELDRHVCGDVDAPPPSRF